MNNQELNIKIAGLLGLNYVGNGKCIKSFGNYFNLPDFCNNWNDLMPLVVKYDINITKEYLSSESGNYIAYNSSLAYCTTTYGVEYKRTLAEALHKVLKALEKENE